MVAPQLRRQFLARGVALVVAGLLATGLAFTRSSPCHEGSPVRVTAAAAAGGGTAGATAPSLQCALPPPKELAAAGWLDWCTLLSKVCVDQNAIVFQDPRHVPRPGQPAAPLPRLHATPQKYIVPWTGSKTDDLYMEVENGRDYFSWIGKPGTRARRGVREPTPDLQHPHFSTCTVPVVWHPVVQENFVHFFKATGAQLFDLLSRTPWRQHAKLVMVTPEGLELPAHAPGLLAPLTNMTVETFADFSARGQPPSASNQLRPFSFEGGRPRCFERMFFCGKHPPEIVNSQDLPITSYAQSVLQYYGQHREGSTTALLRPAAAVGAGTRLRIIMQHRQGTTRQLLNVEELVQRCNSWRFTQPGTGRVLTADCSQSKLGDLETTMRLAQEADIFVGIHGANLMSGFMMRRGGIVVEIWPYRFEVGHNMFLGFSKQDPTVTTSWWNIRICDPKLSEPGPYEAKKMQPEKFWVRDRSLHLPWDALQQVLEAAVTEAPLGNTAAFRRAAANKTQVFVQTRKGLFRRERC